MLPGQLPIPLVPEERPQPRAWRVELAIMNHTDKKGNLRRTHYTIQVPQTNDTPTWSADLDQKRGTRENINITWHRWSHRYKITLIATDAKGRAHQFVTTATNITLPTTPETEYKGEWREVYNPSGMQIIHARFHRIE